jgi:undecaprenyl-diphosphatase
MSDLLEAILLGIIQGLTEFLPVSSSGHLELAKVMFGYDKSAGESMLLTVILHAATALSTIVRKEIIEIVTGLFSWEKEQVEFSGKIILSMVPAAIVGVLFDEQMEALFDKQILLVGLMLVVTGVLLFFADRAKNTSKKVNWSNAIIIGLAQMIAILPGISRSGATISTSVLLGVDRTRAAKFSFLMVVPLILGKMAKDILGGEISLAQGDIVPLMAGFGAAFVTGLFACTWMIALVKKSKLSYFAYYCFVVAAIAIAKGLGWF